MDDDDNGDGADGGHEEHDIKPSMVEVELKLAYLQGVLDSVFIQADSGVAH